MAGKSDATARMLIAVDYDGKSIKRAKRDFEGLWKASNKAQIGLKGRAGVSPKFPTMPGVGRGASKAAVGGFDRGYQGQFQAAMRSAVQESRARQRLATQDAKLRAQEGQRQFQAVMRGAVQETKAKEKAETKALRDRTKAEQQAQRQLERARQAEQKQLLAQENDRARQSERVERERQRIRQSLQRDLARAERQDYQEAVRRSKLLHRQKVQQERALERERKRADAERQRKEREVERRNRPRRSRTAGGEYFRATTLAGAASGTGEFTDLITQGLTSPLQPSIDLERTLSRVYAKGELDKDNPGRQRLRDTALQLGRATEFTATQVAEGLENLAVAGRTTSQSIEIIPHGLNLASTSGMSIADSLAIVNRIMGAYNTEASAAAEVTDLLTVTFNSTMTELDGLGETFKMVAPQAKIAGVEMRDAFAIAGALGQRGLEGTVSGTGMKNLFKGLQGGTKGARKALRFLDVKTTDADGNLRSPIEVIGDIHAAMNEKFGVGKQGAKRANLVRSITGQEGEAALGALIGSFDVSPNSQNFTSSHLGAFRGLLDKVGRDKAFGEVSAGQAKEITSNTWGNLTRLSSAAEGLRVTVGDMIKPTLDELAVSLTEMIGPFNEWVRESPRVTKLIVALGAGAIGVAAFGMALKTVLFGLSAFASLSGVAKGVIVPMAKFTGEILGASKAIGPATKAIGSATAAATKLGPALAFATKGLIRFALAFGGGYLFGHEFIQSELESMLSERMNEARKGRSDLPEMELGDTDEERLSKAVEHRDQMLKELRAARESMAEFKSSIYAGYDEEGKSAAKFQANIDSTQMMVKEWEAAILEATRDMGLGPIRMEPAQVNNTIHVDVAMDGEGVPKVKVAGTGNNRVTLSSRMGPTRHSARGHV